MSVERWDRIARGIRRSLCCMKTKHWAGQQACNPDQCFDTPVARIRFSQVDRFLYHKLLDSVQHKSLCSQHYRYPRTVSMTLGDQYPGNTIANQCRIDRPRPVGIKTYPVIRNGLLGAENESFPESRMLSTSTVLGIVTLIYDNPSYERTHRMKS